MKLLAMVLVPFLLAVPCMAQEVFSVKRCGTLGVPRERHGSFFHKGRLYVLGGRTSAEWTGSVQSSPVSADGTLGEWRNETALPERRNYLNGAVQVVGDCVYVVGGNVSDRADPRTKQLHKARQAVWAKIRPDGTIASWNKGPEFPSQMRGVVCLSTVADDRHLLITGAAELKGPSTDVFICDLASDGTPGPWRVLGPLPTPLWYNGAALLGGRIYLYGGLTSRDRSSASTGVFSAAYDGSALSAWRKEPNDMPSALYSSGFCSTPRCLLAIGGRYANDYGTTAIWFAPLTDGAVQEWKMVKTDLPGNVYISAAVDKATGRCFVSGGQFQTVPKEDAPAQDAVCAFVLPGQ